MPSRLEIFWAPLASLSVVLGFLLQTSYLKLASPLASDGTPRSTDARSVAMAGVAPPLVTTIHDKYASRHAVVEPLIHDVFGAIYKSPPSNACTRLAPPCGAAIGRAATRPARGTRTRPTRAALLACLLSRPRCN